MSNNTKAAEEFLIGLIEKRAAIVKAEYPYSAARTIEEMRESEDGGSFSVDFVLKAMVAYADHFRQQLERCENSRENLIIDLAGAVGANTTTLRWVKASERLPERVGCNYHVKATKNGLGYGFNETAIYCGGNQWDFAINDNQVVVEWLEEVEATPLPTPPAFSMGA